MSLVYGVDRSTWILPKCATHRYPAKKKKSHGASFLAPPLLLQSPWVALQARFVLIQRIEGITAEGIDQHLVLVKLQDDI